jgi:hypothetical protein
MSQVTRIAMWSGPRNISTAMMRSWGNRPDTAVIDEPFYAFYLKQTGKTHPGSAEIVKECETDVERIIAELTGPVPCDRRIFYQKQMTHHLLPEIARDWIREATNCFLIRDPAEVIASYVKKHDVDLAIVDLGFEQQLEIYESFGGPVIDATDVLKNPERMLRLLCEAIGIEFDNAMLSWPPGIRETDGVWAKYWYEEVARSTSFQPHVARSHEVPERFRAIHKRCCECYQQLYVNRLK